MNYLKESLVKKNKHIPWNKLKSLSNNEIGKAFQYGIHSLIDFCIITNKFYKPNWHHRIIAQELEDIESGRFIAGGHKILILCLPPRHGKSELASINFPAWYLGKNPNKEIITASYSVDLATKFGSKTRDLVNSENYKIIFNTRLSLTDKSKSSWRTNEGGSYTSAGIGGPITGKGANCFLIDDVMKNREEADSQVIRDKHWDWFISTAYTRLEPNGVVVIILTRWHLDDLVGRILNHPELSKWVKMIEFPAIATRDEEHRKMEEALWPDRYPLKDLMQIKETLGPYEWSSLYQQKPITSENQEFKEYWIQYRDEAELSKKNTRKFLTVDTAVSKRDEACYTGFCDNEIDSENMWNLRAWKARISPKELIDTLFKLYDERGYERIGIEKTVYLDAIKPFLDEEQRKRQRFLPIIELRHKQIAKPIRIRGLIPRYASLSVFHIKGQCRDLEEEMLTFPKGISDDVLDATAYQAQIYATIQPDIPDDTEVGDDELDPYVSEGIL